MLLLTPERFRIARGYVDHTPLDFTSMVSFITTNWDLEPLALRDTSAQTFMGAFDFGNPAVPRCSWPPLAMSATAASSRSA